MTSPTRYLSAAVPPGEYQLSHRAEVDAGRRAEIRQGLRSEQDADARLPQALRGVIPLRLFYQPLPHTRERFFCYLCAVTVISMCAAGAASLVTPTVVRAGRCSLK